MLRKRNRSVQKDQYMGNLLPDSASDLRLQSHHQWQKHRTGSFFSVPGLFVGFSTKGLSDSDSARSPTSPLDFRFLSNLGNPFRTARSCNDGPQKSWDCSKVGLGIVDSLSNHTKPSGKVLGSSESKNIVFGSQLKINIPNSPSRLASSMDSFATPKSLPENHAISPHTQMKSLHLQQGSSDDVTGTGEILFEPEPSGKVRSCFSYSGRSSSGLTGLTFSKTKLNSENFWSEESKTQAGSPPLSVGGAEFNDSLGMKTNSLPRSFGSGPRSIEALSASEIELSEDYTCVITHGPNPRTTHIYGDCILECHTNELGGCCKKEEQGRGLPQMAMADIDTSTTYPSDDFLSFCYACNKKLEGKDIYIYRGEKAFCSSICRSQEILVEEEVENFVNNSSEDTPKSSCPEDLFLTGMVIAS